MKVFICNCHDCCSDVEDLTKWSIDLDTDLATTPAGDDARIIGDDDDSCWLFIICFYVFFTDSYLFILAYFVIVL